MRHAWKTILLLAVFIVVGVLTARWVVHHALDEGTPESQVRLAGAMAGLFAGGAAAMLVGIGMVFTKRNDDGDDLST